MKIAIAGAGGKMGRTLIEAVHADQSLVLAASFDVGDDIAKAVAAGDVVIDFTRPEGTLAHLDACLAAGKSIVIGTTGFSLEQKARIDAAAKRIPVMLSPNFAVGVNVIFKLAEVAARALGEDYDIEVIEAHHRHKVDAPSGTALELGRILARATGRDLAKVAAHGRDLSTVAAHGREGDTGARPAKQIGFHAVRGGDIVGEHTILFAGTGERVEVTVRSQSRMSYATGALRAAKWLKGRSPGLYDTFDVLGLKGPAGV